jgi:hypothetical protein
MKTTTEFDIEALPVSIQYISVTAKAWGTAQDVDEWRVTLKSRHYTDTFPFYTGMGLRSPIPRLVLAVNPPRKGTLAYEALEREHRKPVKPKIADVLHSLFTDAWAAEYNFHDWCANYGYDSDSIKALNMYKECLGTAEILKRHFDADTRAAIRAITDEM